MAMGKRRSEQAPMWIPTTDLPVSPGHPFYARLNAVETHRGVFTWGQERWVAAGRLKGQTVAIDATTLEANAAMRSIVRRDTGESYQEFLTRLAAASGIKTPTREALARLDRRRKKRTSNKDWENPSDPGREDHEDEGRAHAPRAQSRARRGSGQRRPGGGDAARGRRRGHDESHRNRHCRRGTGRGRARDEPHVGGADRDRRGQGISQQPDAGGSHGSRGAVLHRRA